MTVSLPSLSLMLFFSGGTSIVAEIALSLTAIAQSLHGLWVWVISQAGAACAHHVYILTWGAQRKLVVHIEPSEYYHPTWGFDCCIDHLVHACCVPVELRRCCDRSVKWSSDRCCGSWTRSYFLMILFCVLDRLVVFELPVFEDRSVNLMLLLVNMLWFVNLIGLFDGYSCVFVSLLL